VDTDFTVERLVARANEDLAGGVGNVVNRIVTLVHLHRGGTVPSVDEAPIAGISGLSDRVADALADLDLRGGTQLIIDAIRAANCWRSSHI
jgi:methionyl-tRNA synthetase